MELVKEMFENFKEDWRMASSLEKVASTLCILLCAAFFITLLVK